MTYFVFDQNNSGGFFEGPAIQFVVVADDADTANRIAVANGLYFDGRGDCIECCGNRWIKAVADDATDTLDPVSDYIKKWSLESGVPAILIV